jgi:hypothetical protein
MNLDAKIVALGMYRLNFDKGSAWDLAIKAVIESLIKKG